jgi:hypothetical protein
VATNRSSKSSWLDGPSDLKTDEVQDVPVEGESVLVRGLPAAFSARAQSKALVMKTGTRGEQTAEVDTEKLAVIQFANGVVEPEFSEAEAQQIAEKYGPAFNKVVERIDELSGVDKESIEKANATFRTGGEGANGSGKSNSAAPAESPVGSR